jgi:hypothetical protein
VSSSPDEADQAKHALLALTAQRVLLADAERGQAITGTLKARHLDVIPTSEVPVEVFGDDLLITPSPSLPALVADDRQWIATVVALIAELKSGPFARQTEQSLSQLVERLRTIRISRAESVRIVGGEEIEPPGQTTSFPIDDEATPTVVTWGSYSSVFEELERCAGSVASLIRQPRLAAELQLAFARLGRESSVPPAAEIGDRELVLRLRVIPVDLRLTRLGVVVAPVHTAAICSAAPGTTRPTRRIAAISWVMVSWVATASARIVESTARRRLPFKTPVSPITFLTASLIRWGRPDFARRRRQYTSSGGSNPPWSSGNPHAAFHRRSQRAASAASAPE